MRSRGQRPTSSVRMLFETLQSRPIIRRIYTLKSLLLDVVISGLRSKTRDTRFTLKRELPKRFGVGHDATGRFIQHLTAFYTPGTTALDDYFRDSSNWGCEVLSRALLTACSISNTRRRSLQGPGIELL